MEDLIFKKINSETAKVSWVTLLPFFASGKTIYIDPSLDLIEVATFFSMNKSEIVNTWITSKLIYHVTDEQANNWYDEDIKLWASVVNPWVLVQI